MATERDLDRLQSGAGGKVWVEYVGEIAVIRLDRGENRMNAQLLDALNRCLDEILQRSDIRAVVTVGTGKFYSNGLDLYWMKAIGSVSLNNLTAVNEKLDQTLKRILLFPLPTVAAINGHAFAGGAMLSLCHDYRVMQTERGWFCVNEVHLGKQIPNWLIKLITFKVPGSRAQADVILFGKRLTAKDALNLGVVHKTATSEALLKEALAIAKDSYKGSPGLQREMVQKMKEDTFSEIVQLIGDQPRIATASYFSKL